MYEHLRPACDKAMLFDQSFPWSFSSEMTTLLYVVNFR